MYILHKHWFTTTQARIRNSDEKLRDTEILKPFQAYVVRRFSSVTDLVAGERERERHNSI